MKTFEEVKLHNKPFEEMQLTELYAERSARTWHRSRIKRAKGLLETRKWWLEENMPVYTKEEITAQYESGEITKKQYQTAFARRKRAINQRMKNEDRMNYADRIVYHEEAIIAYIDELIAEELARIDANERVKAKKRKEAKQRGYDPRKHTSKYNPHPLDSQRKWATRKEQPEFPKLQRARARWKKGKQDDTKAISVSKRMQPIITWDVEKLMLIAKDRGYFTEVATTAAISDILEITLHGASSLIKTGRLTWSQCIIIGSLFEMTPKEFCDVFLSGYFREVSDGVYRAYVEDPSALLDTPYGARSKESMGEEDERDL